MVEQQTMFGWELDREAMDQSVMRVLCLWRITKMSQIKRTRKRQIQKAKFMDHGSYEWSQWWHSKARKPKRWK